MTRHSRNGKTGLLFLAGVFWLSSLGSAFAVVYSTYESRKAVQKLEELRKESAELRVMSGQYLLEKSSLAAYSRVEGVAQDKLKMFVPESEETVLVYKK